MTFSQKTKKRIRPLFFLIASILPAMALAGPAGFAPLNNTQALQKALSKNAEQTRSISSDFIQTKNMKMLQDKVVSKGKFYFKQADKIRIEYNSPFSYLLIMNGGNITVKDGNKTNKINTRSSKIMQSINRVMLDCMRGTVFHNPGFSVSAFESAREYLLVLQPKDAAMKKMFSGI
jgi:outer membrane lipoprotein-sorting protein